MDELSWYDGDKDFSGLTRIRTAPHRPPLVITGGDAIIRRGDGIRMGAR
jgi:hypothetical protein